MRATLTFRDGEPPVAAPFPRQDSSMMRMLTDAGCLIVRPAEDPAKAAGDACRIIRLDVNS
jgi:molybdopterin molybdotransferase